MAKRPIRSRRDLILRVGKDLRSLTNRVIQRHSEVGDPEIFEPADFPWTRVLEDRWKDIRQETDAILAHRDLLPAIQDISPDHARIANQDRRWKTFFLWGYGHRMDDNCARCPVTARSVDTIPNLESAFFSVLAPGGTLPRHKGPTKALLTYHLGLRVPDGDCTMRLGGSDYRWAEGRSFLFDDTVKHEVHNRTAEERVVLLIHVRRPVRFPGSLVSRGFLGAIKRSPFIQDALANQEEWLQGFNEEMRRRQA